MKGLHINYSYEKMSNSNSGGDIEFSYDRQQKMTVDEKLARVLGLLDMAILPESADEEKIRHCLAHERIPLLDVRKLRSWLLSRFPDVYGEIHGQPRGGQRWLIDENCPYSLGTALADFGYASSVSLEGWNGKKDFFVYHWARLRGNYDAVVSDDKKQVAGRKHRDLTLVVRDAWENSQRYLRIPQPPVQHRLPVLVHLPTNMPYRDGTVRTFRDNHDLIYSMVESREYAVISVTPGGVYEVNDMKLRDIWLSANELVVSQQDKPAPSLVAQAVRIAKRTAGNRGVSINRLMRAIHSHAGEAYHALLQKNGEPTTDDILGLLDDVLGDVSGNASYDQIMILEMVRRAMAHQVLGEAAEHPFNGDGYVDGVSASVGRGVVEEPVLERA